MYGRNRHEWRTAKLGSFSGKRFFCVPLSCPPLEVRYFMSRVNDFKAGRGVKGREVGSDMSAFQNAGKRRDKSIESSAPSAKHWN
jgi:hypothetical protein